MAYSSGVLVAAGGDVYTQFMDILKAFCETAGWSTNLYADDSSYYVSNTYYASGAPYTGKRLHMQKTLSGTARYINLRTTQGQKVFRYDQYRVITGIAIQGSQGFDSGLAFDQQSGASSASGTNMTYSAGASVDDLPTDVLSYYLFSYNNGDIIYSQLGNASGYVGFVFGTTSTGVYCVGGTGGYDTTTSKPNNLRHGLLYAGNNQSSEGFVILSGTTWRAASYSSGYTLRLPMITDTNKSTSIDDHPVNTLLYCSPDNFKGNAPLIPAYAWYYDTAFRSFGIFQGVKYINMKNIASLTEITYGADTYKLFRQYGIDDDNDATGGLAFLIS